MGGACATVPQTGPAMRQDLCQVFAILGFWFSSERQKEKERGRERRRKREHMAGPKWGKYKNNCLPSFAC